MDKGGSGQGREGTREQGNEGATDIDYVLPNFQNFGCNLYTDSDLFKSGTAVLNGCGGEFKLYNKCFALK